MVELPQALAQIAEIRAQAAKAEVYRGYRSVPVAASGLMGLAAAWLQPPGLAGDPIGFVIYWVAVAICAGFVGVSEIVYNYVVHDEALAKRRTRRVVGQLLPSLLGGALVTASFVHLSTALVPLLPGLWALAFGLGIFASRPYLVRASGWVALYFYAAGAALLWTARGPETLNAWAVGGTFGVGQLLTAGVLYWNLERDEWRKLLQSKTGVAAYEEEEPAELSQPGRFAYDGLERVLHEKARLGIMTSLVMRPEGLLFSDLKRLCALTDGNLSRHLDVLQGSGARGSVEGIREPAPADALPAVGRWPPSFSRLSRRARAGHPRRDAESRQARRAPARPAARVSARLKRPAIRHPRGPCRPPAT